PGSQRVRVGRPSACPLALRVLGAWGRLRRLRPRHRSWPPGLPRRLPSCAPPDPLRTAAACPGRQTSSPPPALSLSASSVTCLLSRSPRVDGEARAAQPGRGRARRSTRTSYGCLQRKATSRPAYDRDLTDLLQCAADMAALEGVGATGPSHMILAMAGPDSCVDRFIKDPDSNPARIARALRGLAAQKDEAIRAG